MPRDSIPSIPAVPSDASPQQRMWMQSVRDALTVRAGQTKNRLDYSPTVRQLLEAGIINVSYGAIHDGQNGPPITVLPPDSTPGDGNPWNDYDPPPAPTGVQVLASPWSHFIDWDRPPQYALDLVEATEVWASEDNNRDNAWRVGDGVLSFAWSVAPLSAYYYWVRHISYTGVTGAWNAGINEGIYAESPPDAESVLDTIRGKITETELWDTLNDRIDHIDITDGGLVNNLNNEIANRTASDDLLSARLATLEEGTTSITTFRNGFEDHEFADWSSGGGSLAQFDAEVFNGSKSGLANYTGPEPTLPFGAIYIELPTLYHTTYAGLAIDVDLYVRSALSNGSGSMAFAYSVDTGVNSGWVVEAVPDYWVKKTFTFVVPTGVEDYPHYICVNPDTTGTGKGLLMDELSTHLSLDLSGIGTNAEAIRLLTERVEINEGDILAQVQETNTLKATVEDPVTGNAALAINVQSNTALAEQNEQGISAMSETVDELEVIVNDPISGVAVNALNIKNQQATIDIHDGRITANASNITNLGLAVDGAVEDAENAVTLVGLQEVRIDQNEDDINLNATDITALGGRVSDIEGEGYSAAIDQLTIDVGINDGRITAEAKRITDLTTSVDGNTASIQALQESEDGVSASWTLRINNNGHIAGFGLASESQDDGSIHSGFGVVADRFWIAHPSSVTEEGDLEPPDETAIAFAVDPRSGYVAMDGAYIKTGTIDSFALGTGSVEDVHIKDATIQSGKIADATIQAGHIADYLESEGWNGRNGWRLNVGRGTGVGDLEINNIRVIDPNDGTTILASGPEGAFYHERINNEQQTFGQITGFPLSMGSIALGGITHGGYGNIGFHPNVAGNYDTVTVTGSTFYHPSSARVDIPENQVLKLNASEWGASPAYLFIMFTAATPWSRWSGYSKGSGGSNNNFCFVWYNIDDDTYHAIDVNRSSYEFTPEATDCVVAAATRSGDPTTRDMETLVSFIGLNTVLPEDGANITGHDNLILDARFLGIYNAPGLNNTEKLNQNAWWGHQGNVFFDDDGGTSMPGPHVYFKNHGSTSWIWQQQFISVTPGEVLYGSLQYRWGSGSGSGHTLFYTLEWYDPFHVMVGRPVAARLTWLSGFAKRLSTLDRWPLRHRNNPAEPLDQQLKQ